MAGMFDWLKGGKRKGRARRRSGGRKGGDVRRRRGAQQRDPGNSTEFISPQQYGDTGEVVPAPPPRPPAPVATPVPSPPPVAQDAGATQYQAVGSNTGGGLVGVLIVKDGKARDEVYKVHDGENTIGRGDAAEIRTDSRDDAVSREHAMIIHEAGSFGIKPLKEGTNPTFLNDDEVSGGAALADGDLIRIGNTTLKFRVS